MSHYSAFSCLYSLQYTEAETESKIISELLYLLNEQQLFWQYIINIINCGFWVGGVTLGEFVKCRFLHFLTAKVTHML